MIQCTCNASYASLIGLSEKDGGTLFYRKEMLVASDNLALIGVVGFFQRWFFSAYCVIQLVRIPFTNFYALIVLTFIDSINFVGCIPDIILSMLM